MLSTLSRAIEARDPYTRGHSARVTALAESIALRLGWSKERLALLHVGGPLHDIGKLAISDEVLSTPGRLAEDERCSGTQFDPEIVRVFLELFAGAEQLPAAAAY